MNPPRRKNKPTRRVKHTTTA